MPQEDVSRAVESFIDMLSRRIDKDKSMPNVMSSAAILLVKTYNTGTTDTFNEEILNLLSRLNENAAQVLVSSLYEDNGINFI